MDSHEEPRLEPPGAGLPMLELGIARVLFRLRRWTGSRDSFTGHFQRERAAIHQLVRAVDAAQARQRVLITRVRGLEDSSRNWSVWMTLDHLRIVNGRMAEVIASLSRGKVPPGEASTAAVKPRPDVTAGVMADYEASCEAVLAAVAGAPRLKTPARFAHPWFGPLDASGWHALAGAHMGIHRVQLERILQGLKAAL